MQIKTFFDQDTGQIIATFSGDIEIMDLSAYDSYSSIEQKGDPYTQYVEDGQVVDMPEKPNKDSVFNYAIKQWQDLSDDVLDTQARTKRDTLLFASDWTQLPDVSIATKESWATYRQQLRDITTQSGYPSNIVWPTPPSN